MMIPWSWDLLPGESLTRSSPTCTATNMSSFTKNISLLYRKNARSCRTMVAEELHKEHKPLAQNSDSCRAVVPDQSNTDLTHIHALTNTAYFCVSLHFLLPPQLRLAYMCSENYLVDTSCCTCIRSPPLWTQTPPSCLHPKPKAGDLTFPRRDFTCHIMRCLHQKSATMSSYLSP